MATNAEQIQEDLILCNVTMWEPTPLTEIQFNIGALVQMEAVLDTKISNVTSASSALADIEDVATGDSGIDDVVFTLEPQNSSNYSWSMIPNDNGGLSFFLNSSREFYNDYIVPAVPVLDVPLQEDLGEGLVDKSTDKLTRERLAFLRATPLNIVETTIAALGDLKAIVVAKRINLEATYV